MTPPLAVLTGLAAEASLLPGPAPAACSGANSERARTLAHRLLDDSAGALLSFGLAGGLDTHLPAGALVLATEVFSFGPCDRALSESLAALLPDCRRGPVASAGAILATPAAKEALRAATGALTVDMESGAVAEACMRAGRPFAVVRVVADPSWRAVPPAAIAALDAFGRVRVGGVLVSLLRRPGQLPGLLRLAADTRAASRSLAAAASRLAPLLVG